MFTTLPSLSLKSARRASSALLFSTILLTGCASGITNVANAGEYVATQQIRPDTVYVYPFASSAGQVKLDSGGLAHKLVSHVSGSSDDAQQASDAVQVREQVADEIVHKLQSMGVHAVRADVPPPADQNVLLVQGSFDKIDAGNRRRRTMIGFGAGESDVGSTVQILYKPAGGMPALVQSFAANADSGKAPGVVETAGVGTAAGHIATSAALGGGMHAVSETKHDTVVQDAKRLGDKIAKQIAQIGVSEGWLSTDSVR
ncbi:DUF4410 domain-containing protein [Paraburkholderia solisilvae]|uniref:DUF4410 domain-containing protein n=1 Tax=Paraburkholderia solisilvae TaxID=624376 RepID=A0A6J5D1N4_9BURK|nr:DUF4410 domain-containing protein [Paraburkholderia solisilvae]CAB3746596.1 hypothetical protein LMG29739_00224 [Paraburkholderia solisilvae]